ncbi:MAG: HepT-like ribonuclease domain-containing protein [Hyphomicrobiales bacterium]|nr:HepT-like ribonuclease domain-containing protein [Hyphomicrobiales bacterium]
MAAASVADRLKHISRSIAAVEDYWVGKTLTDFLATEPLRAATERHLLIISEAVRFIPDQDKAEHPQIPWQDIAGIGNILRHGYDIVDPERIWNVVQYDLAALQTAVDQISQRYAASS